ncbi:MAG: hypothetical protein A3H28_12000 [Acidobacteria bacterium RIFCSPLOWO2_02_FULL_61_28]|nr:MAG: hypothetical protein A3H28_12000 [Acidobacteria bacterium RIFCSPLOWO2_02_FULL_61_28]
MSNFENLVRHYAEIKFGKENEPAISEWVEYWRETAGRNIELVEILSTQTEVAFAGKTVLDIGCGTGGLASVVTEEGGSYIGLDYYPAVLEMAQAFIRDLPHSPPAQLLRGSGTSLPLRDESVDLVTAFDVIEHLVGGESWQLAFLREIRRVLRPDGILLLTTPNRLHPFEPHTALYGPHYLPVPLADRYIRWRNPSFLQEYKTYGEVHLLTPWKMKELLEKAGLTLIPDFPGGKPLENYAFPKRLCLRLLSALGLGWAAPACFWVSACRRENWEQARRRKPRPWKHSKQAPPAPQLSPRSQFEQRARHYAELKFGRENEAAIAKWVGYWTETLARNFELVEAFCSRIRIDFRGKRVLDIGCGTGGLSQIVTAEGGFYIGSDFFPAILEMAHAVIHGLPQPERASLIRASGTGLPLADGSVDIVVAFDVIEHLVGGEDWQLRFLQEIRRVLRQNGLLLLTTPNRLYPFEGHTFLYGPQYLPVWLADRYIRWKNPSFLQEYKTYGDVHLLGPWKLARLLRRAGLRVVHDFPWGMDWRDYALRKRLPLRLLGAAGLAWAADSAFWFPACRAEDWNQVRTLRRKDWLPCRHPSRRYRP